MRYFAFSLYKSDVFTCSILRCRVSSRYSVPLNGRRSNKENEGVSDTERDEIFIFNVEGQGDEMILDNPICKDLGLYRNKLII